MPTALIALAIAFIFFNAYFWYGRRISRLFALDDKRITPACEKNDGYDYVPTNRAILLAQHFASIAAAGPVVGPIAAGLAFGWGPTLAWIVIGCIFIGACHDFSSLVASVRNGARSIPELAKQLLGPTGYYLSLGFIWLCLIYVIIAFTDVTAQQFVAVEEWGGERHAMGGGVATSSFLYLLLSIVMGIAMHRFRVPLWALTLLFFPALLAIIVLGQSFPITFVWHPTTMWGLLILGYCAIASVLPMWLLLQPRGYLGGYFLYLILFLGVCGLVFGGMDVQYPAFRGFFSPKGESIYPFLFITVACGACSGFHGLVCSGTTSKQLKFESHAPLIGYGGMLLEGVVAVMALMTVMIWPMGDAILSKSPAEIYATGIAHLSHRVFNIDIRWGVTFGMLAFATFVYDTLDVATRLGRYLLEELLGLRSRSGRVIATVMTLALPLVYVIATPQMDVGGREVSLWSIIWPLFGSSNQLLAGLTLLLMALWLRDFRRALGWLLLPAFFMLGTSSVALVFQWMSALKMASHDLSALINLVISSVLLVVSVSFTWLCISKHRRAPVSAGRSHQNP